MWSGVMVAYAEILWVLVKGNSWGRHAFKNNSIMFAFLFPLDKTLFRAWQYLLYSYLLPPSLSIFPTPSKNTSRFTICAVSLSPHKYLTIRAMAKA